MTMEKYIKPFVEVCKTVFTEFVHCEAAEGAPFFIGKGTAQEWDISGIIGLAGEARGAVAVSMKKELAFKLTEQLTGQEYYAMDDEVADAIGELVNIIAGNAKQRLENVFNLVISLPSVVTGAGHEIKFPSEQARIMCIPFKVLGTHTFWLSVALESSKGA
jgi:chemotaxis protein CheX